MDAFTVTIPADLHFQGAFFPGIGCHEVPFPVSNHIMPSDWVDYALDQQTVRDPGSGQANKISSSQSTTWVDDSGKTSFQTHDVNANPNGYLKGNWTRQQQVYGDGSNK